MTREEALKILNKENNHECTWPEYCEAYNMAIKALEQKPCEDCISRQEFKEWLNNWSITPIIKNPLLRKLESMTSVQPIRIHAKWEKISHANGDVDYKCSACKGHSDRVSKYCPNCGAKMDKEDNYGR